MALTAAILPVAVGYAKEQVARALPTGAWEGDSAVYVDVQDKQSVINFLNIPVAHQWQYGEKK